MCVYEGYVPVNVDALEGRCPGTGLTAGCEPADTGANNQVPLQEQWVCLATEPALQLPNEESLKPQFVIFVGWENNKDTLSSA